MTRIDWLIIRRIAVRLGVTFVVFFALFALVESLNTAKIQGYTKLGGPLLAGLGMALSGLRTAISALPIITLIGTVAGIIDLQQRRELTIIQSAGFSIWRAMRAPLTMIVLVGLIVAVPGDSVVLTLSRTFLGQSSGKGGVVWLEQNGTDGHYLLRASRVGLDPPTLYDVELFMTDSATRDRIIADSAVLSHGRWTLTGANRYLADRGPQALQNFSLDTETDVGDLRLSASGMTDLTLPELIAATAARITRTDVRAEAMTNLLRPFLLPLMIVGSMLIGIAAAAGYRRNVRYADTVLLAVITGFVLFVVNEMAIRAGSAGVLDPLVAAGGPAAMSVLVGVTALLYSQDGRI